MLVELVRCDLEFTALIVAGLGIDFGLVVVV